MSFPPRGHHYGVLRVYLDQNKWIDLARAAVGHPLGERYEDALLLARTAVRTGAASFPLDIFRYMETTKRGNDRSRVELADTMRELSQQNTMALPREVLDHEIDVALQHRFGLPDVPRPLRVFGFGIRHIDQARLDWPQVDLSFLPDQGASLLPGQRRTLQGFIDATIEAGLLRVGPKTLLNAGFDHNATSGDAFVAHENRIASEIARLGLTGGRIDDAVRASDFGDIRPAVVIALTRVGLTYDEFMDGLTEGEFLDFMDDLPTRFVTNTLRSAKHRQAQQPWEPNDLVDIVALPVASVYCDVLVTEKQWVHRLQQGKVGERYGTKLLTNVAQLVEILTNASRL